MAKPIYKRILLKLSGEALLGKKEFGIDGDVVKKISKTLKDLSSLNVELSVVVGGGNILRGSSASKEGLERSTADYMGMLGTLINAMAIQDSLDKLGSDARVLSAINAPQVAEPYIRRRAVRHLEKGRIVIFAAGTGNPYFSTDTAAALRALEIEADVMIKATKVDGVYDCDPHKNKKAKKFEMLCFDDVIKNDIKVMDQTAFTLCRENNLPVIVLNLFEDGTIKKALMGEKVGTIIKNKGE
ncbi:UMP kinase [bacterium]|nr:UMP kinase [bacterium]